MRKSGWQNRIFTIVQRMHIRGKRIWNKMGESTPNKSNIVIVSKVQGFLVKGIEDKLNEYEEPATHQGKLQYEDYNTIDYDDDNHPMEKYLVVYTPYGYDDNKYDGDR